MEVNVLGLIAILLFLFVSSCFLLILYVKTASQNTPERGSARQRALRWPRHNFALP
uniref:Photosystem II reaction center protein M n=1 Tax=Caulerpa cliftonii TaxID=1004391 RepID=A0A1C9JBQ7_9CHLO|nr:photosystem II protein [Caulerpa cliftonii]AOP19277.1 photosystem II protein [Caulerpa cliftonii]